MGLISLHTVYKSHNKTVLDILYHHIIFATSHVDILLLCLFQSSVFRVESIMLTLYFALLIIRSRVKKMPLQY